MRRVLWVLIAWTAISNSQVITFAWDVPTDLSRITGYELHYGTESGQYTNVHSVPGSTSDSTDVDLGTGSWYAAVRSAGDGIFSVFSNEVSLTNGILPTFPSDPTDGLLVYLRETDPGPPMAVTIGTTKNQACDTTGGASFSHTVDSGTNLLVVAIMGYTSSGTPITARFTAFTWTKSGESAQNFTAIPGDAIDGGGNWSDAQLAYYILPNPNVGAGTIASTSGIGIWSEGIQYYAFNLSGVDLTVGTSGVRASGSNSLGSGTTISETLTTVAGDLVLAWLYQGGDTSVTVQAGQTAIASNLGACGGAYSSLSYEEAVGTSTAVGYQDIGSNEWRALHAIAIAAAAGGGIGSLLSGLINAGLVGGRLVQ